MGVDYSAFGGYGVPVVVTKEMMAKMGDPCWDLEQISNSKQPWEGNDDDRLFEIREWGGRAYDGDGGFVLFLRECSSGVDVRRGGAPKSIQEPTDEQKTRLVIGLDRIARYFSHPQEGRPGWYVAGRVW